MIDFPKVDEFWEFYEIDADTADHIAELLDRYASNLNARLQQTELFGAHDPGYAEEVAGLTAEHALASEHAAYIRALTKRRLG